MGIPIPSEIEIISVPDVGELVESAHTDAPEILEVVNECELIKEFTEVFGESEQPVHFTYTRG